MSLTDSLGCGAEVSYKGKLYRLAPMDQLNVRARYVQHLRQRAVMQVLSLRNDLDPIAVDSLLAAVTRDFAAGLYEFGSPVVRDSMKSPDNQKRLILYMVQENHPEVEPALVDEMCTAIMDEIVAAIHVSDGGPVPKANAPATGQ